MGGKAVLRYFRATWEDNPGPVGDLQHPNCVCHYPRCAHILDPLVVPLELKLTLVMGSPTQQSSMKDTTYNRSSFISILLHGCDRTDYLMMILTKHGYSFTEHKIVCDMKLYCVLWGWDAYTYIPVAEKKLWAGWWTDQHRKWVISVHWGPPSAQLLGMNSVGGKHETCYNSYHKVCYGQA